MYMIILACFLSSIAGSFLSLFLFYVFLFKNEAKLDKQHKIRSVEASTMPKKALKLPKTALPSSKPHNPQGTILHAPSIEEERETKRKEFEKRVYAPREEITSDYRLS